MGNIIFYSDKYKKSMERSGLARGKYVAPQLGEWLMGLPGNWTSSTLTADAETMAPSSGRFVNTSLFSGIGGIELGTHAAFATTTCVERDTAAKEVLEKRMNDMHLEKGAFINNVEDLTEADLKETESITAGFPAQTYHYLGRGVASKATDQASSVLS